MSYPRNRRSPAIVEAHHDAADALDRLITAMESGLPLAEARRRLLEKLTEVGCAIELERIRRKEIA